MSTAASKAVEPSLFSSILTLRHKLTWRKALVGGALAGIAIAARSVLPAAVGPAVAPPGPSSAPAPLPVATIAVSEVAEVRLEQTFSGAVRPGRATDLAFEVSGRIEALHVDEGDIVPAGTELARIDARRLTARLAAIEAELDEARARLAELEAGPRAQTIDAARARVQALVSDLELATLQRERREKLLQEAVVTEEERDDATTRARTIQARLEAERSLLAELEEGTRSERIDAARATVRRLEAEAERAAVDVDDTRLVAPFDAVIARRWFDEGTVVEPGSSVFRLLADEAPEVTIGLPVDVAAALLPGDELELLRGADRFSATVQGLVPEVDEVTRTAVVIAHTGHEAPRLLPRETVQLVLESEEPLDGYWVPLTALTRGTRGLWTAYALSTDEAPEGGHVVERRDLEVLHVRGERALVRGLIGSGDHLIAEGHHRIVPGQRVAAR